MLYCTMLPLMTSATPDGVLRVLDRFDLISWSGTVMPISRAILAGAAFFSGASFATYVIIWYLTELAGQIYPWWLGWRELKRHNLLEGIKPTLKHPCEQVVVGTRHG